MRLIEKAMNNAIQNGVPFKKDNTHVVVEDKVASVYLHGNEIARVNYYKTKKVPTIRSIEITDAGWSSVTTKSRLNALLWDFGWGISQSNWLWYLTGPQGAKQWDGDWVELKPAN